MKFEFKNKNKFKIGSEKGNHSFFKSAFLRPKSSLVAIAPRLHTCQ